MSVAGEVTILFAANSASYSQSVDKLMKQTKQFGASATAAGAEARKSMEGARGTVMVLGEEIGVRLPRHVQAFIAKLPGVADALSAAFSAVAIFAIGRAVVDLGEKIYDFAKKNEEVAKKNAAAWEQLHRRLDETNDELDVTNLKLANDIAKLQGKPQNGLALALVEARVAASKLDDELQTAIKDAQDLLTKSNPDLASQFFSGKTAFGQEQTMLEQHSRWMKLAEAGGSDQMLRESESFGAALQGRMVQLQTQATEATRMAEERSRAGDSMAFATMRNFQPEIDEVKDLIEGQAKEERFIRASALNGALAGEKGPGAGIFTIDTSELYDKSQQYDKSRDPFSAFYEMPHPEAIKLWADQLQAMSTTSVAPKDASTVNPSNLFTRNMSRQFAQPSQWLQTMETVRQSLGDLADQFTNLGNILSNFSTESITRFNDTLMAQLSTRKSMLAGTHLWRGLGGSLARSAGSSALQFGEGQLLHGLGLGHKADGSQASPFWVRSADAKQAMPFGQSARSRAAGSVVSTGILGMLNNSNFFGNLFGGKLFGPGGIFYGKMPGYAEGGMIPSNAPVMVGERGPEILAGAAGMRVTPGPLRGGLVEQHFHFNINGGDPAATQAMIHKTMASYLPQLRSMAIGQIRNENSRVPSQKKIR